ncbi:MAG: helix-turn-helix transcriptional regulator [Bacteroidota bacterium]
MPKKNETVRKSVVLDEKEYLQKLGTRVKSLRLAAGYTNYDFFAYDHNISRTQWGRYENGQDLRYTSLLKVVGAFGMTLEEFFSEGFED